MNAPRKRLAQLLCILLMLVHGGLARAEPLVVDDVTDRTRYGPATTAVVDTTLHEIRLPAGSGGGLGPGILDGRPSGLNFVTVNGTRAESYAFDGQRFVRNDLLAVGSTDQPVAIAARGNQTDMVVLSDTQATWYQFDGSALLPNPLRQIGGLGGPVQVAVRPDSFDLILADGTRIRAFNSTGGGLAENPALSITSGLVHPIAFALHPTRKDVVVLDGTEAKYFSWTGQELIYNPFMSVSGLVSPLAVQLFGSRLFILVAAGVRVFDGTGTAMEPNPRLSIPDAAGAVALAVLGNGNTLAVRFPEELRFYQFDGTAFTENPALRITGLTTGSSGSGYARSAVVTSAVYPVQEPVEALVVRANQLTPPGTTITYEVSGDAGASWLPARPGKGVRWPGGSTAGAAWRGKLATADTTVTPKILPPIRLSQVWAPDPPSNLQASPQDPDGLVRTATPTLGWTFTDRDTASEGDSQSAFQLVVENSDTGDVVYSSGKVSTLADALEPPDDSGGTGVLRGNPIGSDQTVMLPEGALHGGYRFRWRVRVWDQFDLQSTWSTWQPLEVLALYHVRITDIVSPPQPAPALPTSNLPVSVKAGARFNFTVDSLGPLVDVSVAFSDGGTRTTWPEGSRGGPTNSWDGSYFTDPTLPTGTVVNAHFTGTTDNGRTVTLDTPIVITKGSIYDDFTVILTR